MLVLPASLCAFVHNVCMCMYVCACVHACAYVCAKGETSWIPIISYCLRLSSEIAPTIYLKRRNSSAHSKLFVLYVVVVGEYTTGDRDLSGVMK